jgi:hypothetical protein
MKKTVWSAVAIVFLTIGVAGCGSSAAEEPSVTTVVSTASTLPPTTLSTVAPTTVPAAEVVVFNDAVLEKGIRAAMNKPTGDIATAEAATLKELHLDVPWQSPDEIRIRDISALKYFVNLEQVELQFHLITDIGPLAGLVQLKGLAIGGNKISDITPLAGLTKLDFLSIFNCEATDYSPLAGLTNLRHLYVSWSTITDLSVLSGMKMMQDVKIDNCPGIKDVTPLAGLTDLQHLILTGTSVTDFSPLKDIYPNLVEKDFELN